MPAHLASPPMRSHRSAQGLSPSPSPPPAPGGSQGALGSPLPVLPRVPVPRPRVPRAASHMAQGTLRAPCSLPATAPARHMALQASPGAWGATCHNFKNIETDTKVRLFPSQPYSAATQQWPIQRPLGLISAPTRHPTLPADGFKAVSDITGPTGAGGSSAMCGTCGFFLLKVSANGAGRTA